MVNIPNALTLLRALGVPAFLYLFLIADQPVAAFIVIAIGGLTDYLDGKLARALNQSTEFGAKFDPVVDRLYITAVVLALASREYLPWALVIAILARDLIMALLVAYQRLKGFEYVQVSFLGKAATFNLLYAFPFLHYRLCTICPGRHCLYPIAKTFSTGFSQFRLRRGGIDQVSL